MGTLIAKHYRTTMFAKLADHTYVECGTGAKAWGCWGGKTGGKTLRSGTGSTNRANDIAQPEEKANIKCYLINGVCHQAANRILLPANINVEGARGYSISSSLFGPYGRVGFWSCSSPFLKYPNITGDLHACLEDTEKLMIESTSEEEMRYTKRVMEIYDKAEEPLAALKKDAHGSELSTNMQMELFELLIEHKLGSDKKSFSIISGLIQTRRSFENERIEFEKTYSHDDLTAEGFAKEFDDLTIKFQDDAANMLDKEQYKALFDLEVDERIMLADPEIIKEIMKEKGMEESGEGRVVEA